MRATNLALYRTHAVQVKKGRDTTQADFTDLSFTAVTLRFLNLGGSYLLLVTSI